MLVHQIANFLLVILVVDRFGVALPHRYAQVVKEAEVALVAVNLALRLLTMNRQSDLLV